MVIPISKIISCLTFLPTYEQELDVKVPLEEWLSYSNATGEQHCCLCLDDIILKPLKGRPSLLPQLHEKNMTFKDNSGISHESREGLRCKNKKPHSMWDMGWYLQIVFFLFFVFGAKDWTQGLELAKQALYQPLNPQPLQIVFLKRNCIWSQWHIPGISSTSFKLGLRPVWTTYDPAQKREKGVGAIAQWKSSVGSPSYWHVWGPGFDPGLEAEGLLTELVAVWLYMSDIFAVISIFLWLSRWPETIEKKLVCSPFLCVCVQFTYHKIFTRFKYASHWFWSNLQPFLCNSNLSFIIPKRNPVTVCTPIFSSL